MCPKPNCAQIPVSPVTSQLSLAPNHLRLQACSETAVKLFAADAVTVYARALLQTPDWFLQFCEASGPQLGHLGTGMASASGEQLLLGFLDRWLDKFDAIGTPAARKLSALALCNVLTLPMPSVLDRLDPIAAHLTAVWFEVHGACVHDGLYGAGLCHLTHVYAFPK